MFSAPPEDSAFPHAWCTRCQQQTLIWHELQDDDTTLARCLDCDTPLQPAPDTLWSAADLHAHGYVVEGFRGDDTPGGCRGGHCSA
jgi:hypothetical protein